jgi:hypothetical protein
VAPTGALGHGWISEGRSSPQRSRIAPTDVRSGLKLRKPHAEHMSSAMLPTADVSKRCRPFRVCQKRIQLCIVFEVQQRLL